MNLTLSGPMKVFAIVGALAALALVGGMMFLNRPQAEAASSLGEPIEVPAKKKTGIMEAVGMANKVASKANAAAAKPSAVAGDKATPKATTRPAVKPTTAKAATPAVKKAAPKPKTPPKAKPQKHYRVIATNGLPMRIVVALQKHPVVVVALWSKGGKIDEMARDEAARGAAAAGAAYVPIDLFTDAREAEALTLKLGFVLRAPGVLFFTRPGQLSLSLDGFQDHETVAQAAANVLR
jgi:hypothetical protein